MLKEDKDETNIRPQSLSEYAGQTDVKENIEYMYDDIFELVTSYDAEDKNALPALESVLEELWAAIKTKLSLMNATNISDSPDLSFCTIKLSAKTNYFLAEDLNLLANMEESEMEKSSLGAWSSDEDMNIQYDVFDDGRTEIFFPFHTIIQSF